MRALVPNWQASLVLFVFVAALGLTVSWFTTLRQLYDIALDPALASATVVKVDHEFYRSFAYVYTVGNTKCSGRGYLDQGQRVTVGQQISVQYARHTPCLSRDDPLDDPWAGFRDHTRIAVATVIAFAAVIGLLFGRVPLA